jgi:hypothetical protein
MNIVDSAPVHSWVFHQPRKPPKMSPPTLTKKELRKYPMAILDLDDE